MGKLRSSHNSACKNAIFYHQPEHLKIAVDLVLDAFETVSQHEAATEEALRRARTLADVNASAEVQKIIEQLGESMDRSYRQESSRAYFFRHQWMN